MEVSHVTEDRDRSESSQVVLNDRFSQEWLSLPKLDPRVPALYAIESLHCTSISLRKNADLASSSLSIFTSSEQSERLSRMSSC